MRKIILALILTSLLVVPVLVSAAAVVDPGTETVADTETPLPDKSITDILATAANWLFTILLMISTIVIVIAGVMFVSSAGSPEKLAAARNLVIYAIVGIIVAALAKGLAAIIKLMVT